MPPCPTLCLRSRTQPIKLTPGAYTLLLQDIASPLIYKTPVVDSARKSLLLRTLKASLRLSSFVRELHLQSPFESFGPSFLREVTDIQGMGPLDALSSFAPSKAARNGFRLASSTTVK